MSDRRTLETGTEDLVGEVVGPVAVLAFNRPERRNALSESMYGGFARALPAVAQDPSIRVLLVTGRGGAFCAGGDVKGFNERNQAFAAGASPPPAEDAISDLRARQRQVSLALHQLPKPVVAALPGPAAGAGLSIALSADLRLAAERALLVTAFVDIGASGDFGGSWFLTQLVGPSKAKELYMTSPRLTASEAERLGIVNRVLPDDGFDDAALAFCQELASRAPIALRYIKENVNRALVADLSTALDAEAAAMNRTMSTADHREAAAAFVEKRTATFTGR
jgi:2-(1,2-epoxy-1,2-dihydrophenyl)acetyl-CoA isomerase